MSHDSSRRVPLRGTPTRPAAAALRPTPVAGLRRTRHLLAALLGLVLTVGLIPLTTVTAQAAVAGVGPVDSDNGFPLWFSDGDVKLKFCVDPAEGCLAAPPDPAAPISYPDNFPEEAFWFAAEATGGNLSLYEAALEGAHANGEVVNGDQMGFARLRFRLDNLVPGERYTITHPYGVNVFTAAADKKVPTLGLINVTVDAGVCAPSIDTPCNWNGVGAAFQGSYGRGSTATFLRQVGAAAGTLGDINTARAVTGAPSGTNAVIVEGKNAGGAGNDTLTISQFTVQGVLFDGADGAPSVPDLRPADDTGRSSSDNVTSITTPTVVGTVPGVSSGIGVDLLLDGAADPVATTATDDAGGYSIAVPGALAAGVHTLRARIANPAYAVDPDTGAPLDPAIPPFLVSGTLTITVDVTAPATTVVSPFPSNPSADHTPTLNFRSTDATATFECRLQPSNTTWVPCTSPFTYDEQLDGLYTFDVRATDPAGNVGALASFTWRIGPLDTTAPTLTAQSPAAGATAVAPADNVTATFSEPVTGVSGTSFTLTAPDGSSVAATVTYDSATRRATLDPTATLAESTRYTVGLTTAITDVATNAYAGGGWSFTTADLTAPTVTARIPATGATGTAVDTNVTATFSEAVQGVSGTTVTLTSAAGTPVAATVSYDAAARTVTLDPTANLGFSTIYTATLTGGAAAIRDQAGNPLTTGSWSFTTVAAPDPVPTVTGRTPVSGATGVAVASNVTATFSEAVQGVSTTSVNLTNPAGTAVAAAVTYNAATNTATLDPTADLAFSTTYTARLTGGATAIRDSADQALASISWTFTTVAAPDPVPTVTGRTPASGATGVAVASNVTATFSEAVQGVSTTSVTLTNAAGTAVAAAVTYNAATNTATLDPTADLAFSTTYTARLTGGTTAIRDSANQPLASVSWTFTTVAGTTNTPPTVTARTPADAATVVSTAANVTATFSEAVTGYSATTFTLRTAAGASVAATVTYNATTRVLTLDPTPTLANDTRYTATLTGGTTAIRDTAGAALTTTSWSFTTGPAPTITARTPASGATAVNRSTTVTVTFSEAVQNVSGATFLLRNAAGTTIGYTVSYNATTRVATLTPSARLTASSQYSVTVTNGIRDTAGNPMSTTSWNFTTGTA